MRLYVKRVFINDKFEDRPFLQSYLEAVNRLSPPREPEVCTVQASDDEGQAFSPACWALPQPQSTSVIARGNTRDL